MPEDVYIVAGARTPMTEYVGALKDVSALELGAIASRAALERAGTQPAWVEHVVFGNVLQTSSDAIYGARHVGLKAGLPIEVPALTVNRLCGSGLDALALAARTIRCGEAALAIAGGVESMSRAPFVLPKAESAFSRAARIEDTTIGWRFVNPLLKANYGIDSMPETAENVAAEHGIARADQDADLGAATRVALLDRLASDGSRVVGFHLPYPGEGRIERSGAAYRFAPAA